MQSTNKEAQAERPCACGRTCQVCLATLATLSGVSLESVAGSGTELQPGEPPEVGKSAPCWRWDKKRRAHIARWPNAGRIVGPQRSIAWRVIDAQYFGVAQRRRRVFVVASARAGFDPSAVLFESAGVRRDTAPSRTEGQDAAGSAPHSFAENSRGELRFEGGDGSRTGALSTGGGKMGQGVPAVVVVHGTQDPVTDTDRAFALGRNNGGENAVLPIQNATRGEGQNGLGVGGPDDPMYTLDTASQHGVATTVGTLDTQCGYQQQAFQSVSSGHVIGTLTARGLNALGARDVEEGVLGVTDAQVRKLTPTECERLQGFPDNHTRIPYRNKPADQCPDGPRYKAIGNSKAVPCVRFVGERLLTELNRCEH